MNKCYQLYGFSFIFGLFFSPLYATTWFVTTTTDTESGSGTSGSLRYCMTTASPGDTIDFALTGSPASATLTLTASLLAIPITQSSLSIQNTSPTAISISGGNAIPIFCVPSAAGLSINGSGQGLALIDGLAQGGAGGVGAAAMGAMSGGSGGGGGGLGGALFIANGGSATLSQISLTNNQALGGAGGSSSGGDQSSGGGFGGAKGNNGTGGSSGTPSLGGGGGGGGGWGLGNGGGGGGGTSSSPGTGGTGVSGNGGNGSVGTTVGGSPIGGGGGGGAVHAAGGPGGFGGGGGGAGEIALTGNGGLGGFGGGGGGSVYTSGSGGSSVYGGGTGGTGPECAGGGGGAFGGAVFVRQGGVLSIGDGVNFGTSSNTVTYGSAGAGGNATHGSAYGPDLYINSGSTLTFTPTTNATFAPIIAGDTLNSGGGVVLNASSSAVELTLSGTNTYGGSTTLTQGTLLISSDSNLGASTTSLVLDGGTLSVDESFTLGASRAVSTTSASSGITMVNDYSLVIGQSISGMGGLTVMSDGSGTLVLSSGSGNSFSGGLTIQSGGVSVAADNQLGNTSGSLTLNGGTLEVTESFALSGSRSIQLANNTTSSFDIASGKTLTISQAITDGSSSGGLELFGGGTLLLEGNCTYSRGTAIEQGTLALSGSGQISSSESLYIDSGATFNITASTQDVNINTLSGSGNINATFISGPYNLIVNQTEDRGFNGALSGNATFILSGDNYLNFAGASNSYSGGTTIEGSTLYTSADSQLGTGVAIFLNGGTFGADGTYTLGNGTPATRTLSVGSDDGGFDVTNGNTLTIPQNITGVGAIYVDSYESGYLAFTNSMGNSFEGGLYIDGGVLTVSQDNQLGTAGGTLELGGGTLQVTTGFTLDNTRSVSTDDDSSGIDVATGQTLTISQAISGGGGLRINPLSDTGTLILEASCTYTDDTVINAGTLTLTGNGAIADSSSVTIDGGATLDVTGVMGSISLNNLSGAGTMTGNMQALTIYQSNDETFSGAINGINGLTKEDSAELDLTGTSNYTGGTVVDAGTLGIGGDASLGNTSGSLAIGNATLTALNTFTLNSSRAVTLYDLNSTINVQDGDTFTIDQTIANGGSTGGLTVTGGSTGTLILGGTNTYSGGTTIDSGALSISADVALGNTSGFLNLNGGYLLATADTFALSGIRTLTTSSYSGGIDVVTSQTLTIPQAIANGASPGALILNGFSFSDTGTLILGSACTYTGPTVIYGGTLALTESGAIADASSTTVNGTLDVSDASATSITIPTLLGSGSIVGTSGQTLYVVQASDETFSGGVSGLSGLVKQGSATLTFTGTNSYDTGTTIETGTLQVSADAALGNPMTGFVTLDGGTLLISGTFALSDTRAVSTSSSMSTINVQDTYELTIPQDITGTGALTVANGSTGVLALNGTNNFNGGLTLSSGILTIEQDRALGAIGGSVSIGAATLQLTTNSITLDDTRSVEVTDSASGIDIAASKTLTIPQGISGSGGISINPLAGTGTLTLQGSCDYTGPTLVNAGTLVLTGTGSIADSTSVTISSGTLLDLTGVTTNVSINNLSSAGDVNTSSSSANALSIVQTQANEIDGLISGAGPFKLASGNYTMTLTHANTLTGPVIINAGTLALSGSGSFDDSSAMTIASGSTLDITAISGGSATIGSLSGAGTISTAGKSIAINQSGDTTFSGTIGGSGTALSLSGSDTLTLNGASLSYTGATTISGGTLALSGTTSLSDSASTSIASEATLDVSAATTSGVTLNVLSGAGDLIATGQALTINQTSDETFSGVISGDGASLYYTGGSTLTLSSGHTFTGSTEINNGTIALSGSGSLSNSPSMTIDVGATLDTSGVTLEGGPSINTLSGAGDLITGSLLTVIQTSPGTFSGNVTGSAHLILQGTSTLTLSGSGNNYSGGTEIQSGVLSIASDVLGNVSEALSLNGGVLQATGTFELATGRAVTTSNSSNRIDIADGETLTISQAITDGSSHGGLTVTSEGAGILVLGGACTYHGLTTVSSGTLALSGSGALTHSASTSIASGATLDISGTTAGATLNILSGTGTLVTTGKTVTLNQTTDTAFSGTITGAGGSVNKTGTGTFSLTGTMNYSGNTQVSEGTLSLNTSLTGGLSVLSGATVSGVCTIGGDVTIHGTIAPGNSPGDMTIIGNLVLDSDSITDITITPVTNSKLIVTGSATLGGSLVIIAQPGVYLGQTQYTILTAAGYVTPSFASISGGAPGSELSISYDYNGMGDIIAVILSYLTQLRDLTLTGNSLKFINYLNQNSADPALEPIFTALALLSPSQLENAAIVCTPARNATATFASQNTMFSLSRSISTHMADQRLLRSMYKRNLSREETPEESIFLAYFEAEGQQSGIRSITPSGSVKKMARNEDIYSLWIDGFTEFSHQDAQNQIPAFKTLAGGALLGFDAYLNNRGEVGMAVGYARNSIHEGQGQGHNSANLFTATLYGTAYLDNAYIEAAVWGTYDQYQTERTVSFPGFYGKATAQFHGWQATPHLGIGYDFAFKWGILEPFVMGDWIVNFTESYTEHGASPLNMTVQSSTATMLRVETGINCYQTWENDWGIFVLKEMASYIYKQPRSVGKVVAAIVGAEGTFFNDSFTTVQHLYSPSLEFFFRHKKSGCFSSLLYEGEFGDGFRANEAVIRIGRYF